MRLLEVLDAVRVVGAAAAQHGLTPCSFRFDPTTVTTERRIRTADNGHGGQTICVVLPSPAGRDRELVVLDAVDGVLAANGATHDRQLRREILFDLMTAGILGEGSVRPDGWDEPQGWMGQDG